jgi:hypothetical protein
MSPVRHLNSGTTVPTTHGAPANPNVSPPPNTYVNPASGQPQPQPTPGVTKNSGIVDAPDGPTLKPSFPAGSNRQKK